MDPVNFQFTRFLLRPCLLIVRWNYAREEFRERNKQHTMSADFHPLWKETSSTW